MRFSVIALFLTLVVLKISLTGSESATCDSVARMNCTCSTGTNSYDYELDCPISNTRISIKIKFNSHILLDCGNTPDYIQHLPSFQHLGIKAIKLQECTLPDKSALRNIVKTFGTQKIEKMRINYSRIKNITRAYLSDFKHLECLYLQQNDLERLPEELLFDLKNLTTLSFLTNKIKLSPKFFQQTLNLTSIELGENNMNIIPDGLFANLSNLQLLNLWTNNLTELPKNVFADLKKLDSLDLRNNNLMTLSGDIFQNLTELTKLSLDLNKLETLPEGLFKNNKKLFMFLLDNNLYLNSLPENLFANLINLEIVHINNCNLRYLPKNLFMGATKIKDLQLGWNKLEHLPANIFKDMTELNSLQLENNRLTSLPENMFKQMSNLKKLNLQNNRLILTDSIFNGLYALERLSLQNNGLTEFTLRMMKHMPAMRVIDLSANTLSYDGLTHSAFTEASNLEQLILKNNTISRISIDWKYNLPNLRKLDLSYNNFKSLEYNDMLFTQRNIEINLKYNQIKYIDMHKADMLVTATKVDALSSYSTDIVRVYIENNPLQCDCRLYDLVRYFDGTIDPRVRMLLEINAPHLTCTSQDGELDVKKLNSKTFTCDLPNDEDNHSCPDRARCLYRQYDNMYIVNSSHLGLTEIPVIGEHKIENIEVHLEGNQLQMMPLPGMGYEKTKKLYMSHNEIKDIPWIPPNLTILELHSNKLTQMNSSSLNYLNATTLTNITLYDNPWECNCDTSPFTKFLQANFRKVDNLHNITCKDSSKLLTDLTENEMCPLPVQLIVAASVTIALLGLIIGIIMALYYRFNHQIKVWCFIHEICRGMFPEEELDKDKVYDAFISYSHKDEDFVLTELVKHLEAGPNSFKLCLHFRNWQPGEYITRNIANSVEKSRRTLVVLSPNFLESEWGKMEFRTAHIQALKDNIGRVIVILYGDIGKINDLDPELKAYLQTNTYIKWGQPWFWQNLQYAMPHKSKHEELEKIKIGDKQELISTTTLISTTPPADIIQMDPLIIKNNSFSTLNVSLVNGSLVNGNRDMIKDKNLKNLPTLA